MRSPTTVVDGANLKARARTVSRCLAKEADGASDQARVGDAINIINGSKQERHGPLMKCVASVVAYTVYSGQESAVHVLENHIHSPPAQSTNEELFGTHRLGAS